MGGIALIFWMEYLDYRTRRRRRRQSTVPADAGRVVLNPVTAKRCNCTRCRAA